MPADPLAVIAESYQGIHESTQLIARTLAHMDMTQHEIVRMQRVTHLLLALALVELGLLLLGTAGLLWWHLTH